jgi:hypothetical protein
MPKSRKFRENRIDFPDPRPDPIREALIKAKRDVPFTELRKFLPRPKTILLYRQKNHGKYREPSIVILNQKIQGRSKKMGRRPSIGKHKKTRRNRTKKYKKGMIGGVDTPPRTPTRGFNMVKLPQPETPPRQQSVPKEPTLSPKDKGTTEVDNSEGLQPTILFPMDN